MSDFDIIIRGGLVIDGSGKEGKVADIGIKGDRIEAIGDLRNQHPVRFIDAKGLTVSPGFIDVHAHSEFTLLAEPKGSSKVMQGVTTEINGNCGLSAAPLFGRARQQREGDLKELGIKDRWSTFRDYLSILERNGLGLNFVTLVGHGNIRASILGYDDREPTEGEMVRMKGLIEDALKEGAYGLSTGLCYPPGVYSSTEELIELSKVVSRFKGIYSSHLRNEGDSLLDSIEEAIRIGKEAGIPVEISHLKTSGERNWGKIDSVFKVIEDARDNGLDITCDRYPYIASSTDLDAILPSWTYRGGIEEELKRLKDSRVREGIKKEILSRHPDKGYWEGVKIASLSSQDNKWMEGKSLSYISSKIDKDPVDALFHILVEEDLRVSAIYFSMSEDNLRRILKKPYIMIGTDSSALSTSGITAKGKPHPRGFGTFPRILGRYVREESVLSLEEAVYKMTFSPAKRYGIKGRGLVKEGYYADLVVFDHKRIIDRATFDNPFGYPDGIIYVFVNGIPVVEEARLNEALPGRILRRNV